MAELNTKKIKIKVARESRKWGENIKITVRTKRKNPAIIKIPEKTYFSLSLISKSLMKITAIFLIVALNWSGLSAVIETLAYLNDVEDSTQNVFSAGTLDFVLSSPGDFSPLALSPGESATRTVDIINLGNIHKYTITATNFVGGLCDYLNLEANLDGDGVEYTGKLTEFTYGPIVFEEPESWLFTLTLPADAPENVQGETCQFNSLVFGSQTKNDLPFGQGFNDTEDIANNIASEYCYDSEIRSCGYWKNHSGIYAQHLPQSLGSEVIDTVQKASNILKSCGACGCGCDNSMRTKLKAQLLAMKFNIAHFGIGEYLVESEGKTLNEIVAQADNLLIQDPPPPDSVLEEMKNLLDYLNNLGYIELCSVNPPNDCRLRLTKTTESEQVKPSDTITYHFTFDNVGRKVCTGGGVRIRDTFGNLLQYLDYTSTREPKYFNESCDYLEWNFGSIYPDDPLIEIDLRMKVKSSAQCDSVITNSAKYWSDQTDWGEPVSADSQVVCPLAPETGIVINEFLPNPVGNDNALKPNGEWVELYNNTGADVEVAGWWLYDAQDSHELAITNLNTHTGNTLIPNGGFLVVYRNGDSDFSLNNTGGDTVRLYNGTIASGSLVDSYTYTVNALEGKSFARIPDGSDNWMDPIPTPGEPNDLEDEEVIFGPAISEPDEEIEDGDEVLPEEELGTESTESTTTEETVEEEDVITETIITEDIPLASDVENVEPEQAINLAPSDDSGVPGQAEEANTTTEENTTTVEEEGIIDKIYDAVDSIINEIIEQILPDEQPIDESVNETDETINEIIEEILPDEQPIDESVNETDETINEIIEQILPDEPTNEETPIEDAQVIEETAAIEEMPTVQEPVIEEVPAIEEQPASVPDNDSSQNKSAGDNDNSGSSDGGGIDQGGGSGENVDGGSGVTE